MKLNQIIKYIQTYNLCVEKLQFLDFEKKNLNMDWNSNLGPPDL